MINIKYAALSIRAQTEKTTFSCKDDCTLDIGHIPLEISRFRSAIYCRCCHFYLSTGSYWAKTFPRGVTGWVGGKLGLKPSCSWKLWMRLKKTDNFLMQKFTKLGHLKIDLSHFQWKVFQI